MPRQVSILAIAQQNLDIPADAHTQEECQILLDCSATCQPCSKIVIFISQ
jgi:hypothetical protein